MKTNSSLKRVLLLFLAAVVMIVFMPTAGRCWNVHAAKKNMKLPKQLTIQRMTDDGWVKFRVIKFKYNKYGDVTKIDSTYYWNGKKVESETITLKYKYKNGKKLSATGQSSDYNDYKFKLNKAGRLVNVETTEEDSGDTHVFAYDKNGYLKSDRHTYENNEDEDGTEVITYTTTLKGSTLKRIVVKDRNGKTIRTYNKNGGLKTAGDKKYTYKMKGAYVNTKTVQQEDQKIRIKYKYGSTKATKVKYWKNMNNDERIIIAHVYDPDVMENGDEEDHFDDDAPFIDE